MADNKKDVIIQGDVPSLQKVTDDEQTVAGRLLRLEKKRMAVMEDICLVTNKKVEELTVSGLIDMMASQPTEQQRLKKVSDELIEDVQAVKQINDLNKELIQQSLDFVDFTVNAINSSNQMPTGNQYQNKGGYSNHHGSRTFFDAKQ
jgi:flagellar biosynthesis/type III secretory pathway chaperone